MNQRAVAEYIFNLPMEDHPAALAIVAMLRSREADVSEDRIATKATSHQRMSELMADLQRVAGVTLPNAYLLDLDALIKAGQN